MDGSYYSKGKLERCINGCFQYILEATRIMIVHARSLSFMPVNLDIFETFLFSSIAKMDSTASKFMNSLVKSHFRQIHTIVYLEHELEVCESIAETIKSHLLLTENKDIHKVTMIVLNLLRMDINDVFKPEINSSSESKHSIRDRVLILISKIRMLKECKASSLVSYRETFFANNQRLVQTVKAYIEQGDAMYGKNHDGSYHTRLRAIEQAEELAEKIALADIEDDRDIEIAHQSRLKDEHAMHHQIKEKEVGIDIDAEREEKKAYEKEASKERRETDEATTMVNSVESDVELDVDTIGETQNDSLITNTMVHPSIPPVVPMHRSTGYFQQALEYVRQTYNYLANRPANN